MAAPLRSGRGLWLRPRRQFGAGLAGVPADEVAEQAGPVAIHGSGGRLELFPQGILDAHRAPRASLAGHGDQGVMTQGVGSSCGCHDTHSIVGVVTPQFVSLRTLRRRRWGVRAALFLGIAASVSANVLHAEPNAIARVISSWPPVAILIALELVSRVPATGWLGRVRNVALAVVAGIAAWVSYWHMAGVAARYGEAADAAHLLPISVDGLIVVASVSLVILSTQIRSAEQPPPEDAPAGANPSPEDEPLPAEEPTQSGNGHDAAKARRMQALADLANGGDPKVISAAAGVSLQTLQRWADDAAKAARLPRGGPRKSAPGPAPEDVDAGTVPASR